MFIVCLTTFFSILSPLYSASELRESACLLCVWLFSSQSCLHFSKWVTWKCMFIVCLTIFFSILSPSQMVSYMKVHVYCVFDYFLFNLSPLQCELRESAVYCVYFLNLVSTSAVSYVKVHVYCVFDYFLFNLVSTSESELRESACLLCVFDYFLFNLVSTSGGELHESACLLCVWLFSLQSCLHYRKWVTWKCMFSVCLTIFSSISSPLQEVSYMKVHVYCVFDYFLFNLVSTTESELRESAYLVCVWLFPLQSCHHFMQLVSYVKVHMFDYFLLNLVSNSDCELRKSARLLCVWLFSLQSCLHFRMWVTWKCMFIMCSTIFSSILSSHQSVSYVKREKCMFIVFDCFLLNLVFTSVCELHKKCMFIVFDYFLFNHVSTSAGELHETAWLLCVWLFSLQSCLNFRKWVTWKCMFIVCLTIFFSIMSSLQEVSYVKVHVYCVFDYFLLNLVSIPGGELRESACLLCTCLTTFFSILSPLNSASELRESACLLCVWLLSSQSCLHLIQRVSYVKVHVYCVFDYFLLNHVFTSGSELRESACLLCVWLFSSQSCLHLRWWVTWKCMFIVCLTIFS